MANTPLIFSVNKQYIYTLHVWEKNRAQYNSKRSILVTISLSDNDAVVDFSLLYAGVCQRNIVLFNGSTAGCSADRQNTSDQGTRRSAIFNCTRRCVTYHCKYSC